MCDFNSLNDEQKQKMREFLHKTWVLERHFQSEDEATNEENVQSVKNAERAFIQLKALSDAKDVGDDFCCEWYDVGKAYETEDSAICGHGGFGDKGFGKNYALIS